MYENEDVNFEQFKAEVDFMMGLPITGMVVGGSTGEGYALTYDEYAKLTTIAVEGARGRVPVVGGIITTTMRDAIARARIAREAGATGLLVTPPIYQKHDLDTLTAYGDGIYQATGMPIIVYNVLPSAPVTAEQMKALAKVDAIVGTKESAGCTLTNLSEVLVDAGDDITVIWATDHMMFPGLALGPSARSSRPGRTTWWRRSTTGCRLS